MPGGYVRQDDDLDEAVVRVLKDRAGVTDVFLEEFGVFGRKNRSQLYFEEFDDSLFQKQRFISVGYYALYNSSEINPIADDVSEACEWVYLRQLPEIILGMDHREIIEKALLTLREKISTKPIGYNLMPEKFTLPELQKLYEAILGKSLNRGNFYRKIKNLNVLKSLMNKDMWELTEPPNSTLLTLKTTKKPWKMVLITGKALLLFLPIVSIDENPFECCKYSGNLQHENHSTQRR